MYYKYCVAWKDHTHKVIEMFICFCNFKIRQKRLSKSKCVHYTAESAKRLFKIIYIPNFNCVAKCDKTYNLDNIPITNWMFNDNNL